MRQVQEKLQQAGFHLTADGWFDQETEQAVRQFQQPPPFVDG